MNADEFVTKLKEIAPAKAVLLGCGYGADEADSFIKSFECRRRYKPLGIESNDDSMLNLLNKWDISHVVIGPICFHIEPVQFDGYFEIGTIEGDRIVYRPDTKDYVLLDWRDLSHVMCDVASQGDLFLDGLFEIRRWLAKNAVGEIDLDNENIGADVRDQCIAAFGGSKYEAFCTTALGV
jgi:hypothetical protein